MSISKLKKKKSQRKKMQEMLKVLPHFATRPGCYFFLPVLLMAWSFYTFGYGAILPPLYKTNVSFRQCFNFLKGRCSLTEKKKQSPSFSLIAPSLQGQLRSTMTPAYSTALILYILGLWGFWKMKLKGLNWDHLHNQVAAYHMEVPPTISSYPLVWHTVLVLHVWLDQTQAPVV